MYKARIKNSLNKVMMELEMMEHRFRDFL